MHRIAQILFFLAFSVNLFSQNPHGENLAIDCIACHSSESWEIAAEHWQMDEPTAPDSGEVNLKFDHEKTDFPLTGQHAKLDCRGCHESLVFSEAQTGCISCHTDLHQMTVGNDCARCHSSETWLVDNIFDLHDENGFPLLGKHGDAACVDCHGSETELRFDRIGNECVNCHLDDFMATTSPGHQAAGYSLECMDCHDPASPEWFWTAGSANHSFFPLEKGHEINDCNQCHTSGNFMDAPTDCFACHQTDFEQSANPDHQILNFSTDCAACHTIDLGWMPAAYQDHDAEFFPIYSGKHEGEWDACTDCHTNPADYSVFSCTICHTNPGTDSEHNGVSGYVYESTACLVCHPNGDGDGAFDHNTTDFPLTGAHENTDCLACHTNGYAGTPTDCFACHETDFGQTANPDHQGLGFSTDCAACHTTDLGWMPATYQNHDAEFFPIYSGKHDGEWEACTDCHTNPSDYSVFSCTICHTNPGTDSKHNGVSGYVYESTACLVCHPNGDGDVVFDHNTTDFPLTGAHENTDCVACHAGGYAGTPTDCFACHETDFQNTTSPDHEAGGFPTDCSLCHSTDPGWEADDFTQHDDLYFPIFDGKHEGEWDECNECHTTPGDFMAFSCIDCHEHDDPGDLADEHDDVSGYSYNSQACYQCHPDGKE